MKPPSPLHEYDVPPDEVKFNVIPAQIGPLFDAVGTGKGLTVTVVVVIAVHKLTSVTVTE